GRRDGDRHEQDPLAWWQAVCDASREALRDVVPERVRGVATCATSGTVLLVDGAGEPLTPGLMYDDARAGEQAARIGGGMSPSWGLPKLEWMLDAWPQLARGGARLAHQADVVTRRLAGCDVPSDSSHALKSGYDQLHERWSPDAPAELMPEVVRSGTLLGEVCERAAGQTAIPAGTPLYAGMTDGCAAQLAAGALRDGDWNAVLGTTLVLKGFSSQHVRDPAAVLYSHRAPGGGWMPGGASSTGAGVLSARYPDRDLDELGRRGAAFERTSVLAYPLVSRGERFPFAAADAQAFVLGEPACEAELFAALLQGVAFVERLCFDYVDLLGAPTGGELTLTGGATRSRAWCQLRADVLGRAVRLVQQPQPAVGMAILAASGGGDPARAADAIVRTSEVLQPRPARGPWLTEQYLRLVEELAARGWLGAPLAQHARARAGI
ncbi:MAG: D-ribulokinase, partial [Solirubrobacteraceae bacterium]|nr:D-ribulokinase [Solirubrobacteraceae bacterium]